MTYWEEKHFDFNDVVLNGAPFKIENSLEFYIYLVKSN